MSVRSRAAATNSERLGEKEKKLPTNDGGGGGCVLYEWGMVGGVKTSFYVIRPDPDTLLG